MKSSSTRDSSRAATPTTCRRSAPRSSRSSPRANTRTRGEAPRARTLTTHHFPGSRRYGTRLSFCALIPSIDLHQQRIIRNPVVEYTYAKEDRVVASCDYGRVGAPLQESEGPRRTLSPSDRMAAERGKEDRGGVRGHRLQPRLGAQNSPPLQRVGSGRAGRPSPLQPRRQGEGAAG